MGILSNRRRGREQWGTTQPGRKFKSGTNNTVNRKYRSKRRGNRSIDELLRLTGSVQRRKLYDIRSWWSISILPIISRTRDDQPDDHTTYHHNRKRNRYYKHLYPVGTLVLSLLSPTAALAESVGGVSATANPIANSSGSVTNQAIQVLQGPYITNTYGNQISCQGATFNATPYIQYSNSWKDPFERMYRQPQYNNNDFTGRTTTQTVTVKNYPWYDGIKRGPNNADGTMGDIIYEADGVTPQTIEENWYDDSVKTNPDGSIMMDDNGTANDTSDDFPVRYFPDGADMQIEMEVDGPDGVPDNPGQVVWEKPVRTDMVANNSFNIGLSATLSIPLDNKLQNLCKEAATTQIQQQQQITANKRLDFEIARLKNCGELMQKGIMFHPQSPYAAICADVVVTTPPGTLMPHSHNLPRPTFPEVSARPSQPQLIPAASKSSPSPKEREVSSLGSSLLRNPSPSLLPVSQPLEEGQPGALLGGPIQLRLPQLSP